MLIFGHTGITLGTAALLNRVITHSHRSAKVKRSILESQASPRNPFDKGNSFVTPRLVLLAGRIDVRLLLIGSLLPDIIDKPVGMFFLRDIFSNGRIFCHTLLFLIVVSLGGLYLYWKHTKTWLLVLSFGTFMHLVLDGMWLAPQTLLWPLYGFSFPKFDPNYWMEGMFYRLLLEPLVWIPELVGISLIIWFVWFLVRKGNLGTFIRNGRV